MGMPEIVFFIGHAVFERHEDSYIGTGEKGYGAGRLLVKSVDLTKYRYLGQQVNTLSLLILQLNMHISASKRASYLYQTLSNAYISVV